MVFCKHKERETYEIPGGHRDAGEAIEDTANNKYVLNYDGTVK